MWLTIQGHPSSYFFVKNIQEYSNHLYIMAATGDIMVKMSFAISLPGVSLLLRVRSTLLGRIAFLLPESFSIYSQRNEGAHVHITPQVQLP